MSFEPIIDENCKILILGTMPSVKSLENNNIIETNKISFGI